MMFFSVGSSKVIITQPGMPCYKLGFRLGRMDIIKKFFLVVVPEFTLEYMEGRKKWKLEIQ